MARGLPLLVPLSLLLAGCTLPGGGPEDAPEDVTTTTPTPTTASATPTPATTPPTPTPASPNPTPGAARNPVPRKLMQHDHAQPPRADSFDVPVDPLPTNLTLHFVPTGFAGVGTFCSGDARVRIVDPHGATFREAAARAGEACGAPVTASNVTLAPGRWTVRFEGSGNVTSFVDVGGGAGNGTDASPADVHETHDFTHGAEASVPFDVPAGPTRYDVALSFAPLSEGGACAIVDASIRLLDPSGNEALALAEPGLHLPGECASTATLANAQLAPGGWTLAFAGRGAVVGTARVAPSP